MEEIKKLRVQSDGDSTALRSFPQSDPGVKTVAMGHLCWVEGGMLWAVSQETPFAIGKLSSAYTYTNKKWPGCILVS